MKKFMFYLFGFVALQVVLFVGAVSKSISYVPSSLISGYPVHVAALFVVSLFTWFILTHEFVNIRYPMIWVFIYACVLAVAVEVVQMFIPYRTFDVWDMIAGAAGSLLFIVVMKVGQRFVK